MTFSSGILGVVLIVGFILGKIGWAWAFLGVLILYISVARFKNRCHAASNALLARYTFNGLPKADREKVLAAVSKIMSDARYPIEKPEQTLRNMTPAQRYGFLALGMAELGIKPTVGEGWYSIGNPFADILRAQHEITWMKHQIKIRYGIEIDLDAESSNLVGVQNETDNEDSLYRRARDIFDQGFSIPGWNEKDNPVIFSAFEIFQRMADKNFGKAYYPLSILYRVKRDSDVDHARHFAQMAFDWCLANQSPRDAELCCDLGNIYLNGYGVEQNDEQAAHWFRLAAEQGNPVGQRYLGFMYDLWKNYREAAKWYQLAAEQGDALAQNYLGDMYAQGRGVDRDDAKAANLYRKYAEQALNWYLTCGEKGNALTHRKLGFAFDRAKDDKEAMKWYRLAADQGDTEAQLRIGEMYFHGWGVEIDEEQATFWFSKAAEQGNNEAKRQLALIYGS